MRFEIVYYTGTGSTALVAKRFQEALLNAGNSGGIRVLSMAKNLTLPDPRRLPPHDLLVLLFPIYSFNAPGAVLRWLENIPSANNIPAAVVSVSGGGDCRPNDAGRIGPIKLLESKGYDIVYDGMFVMPSNFMTATGDLVAAKLLEVLPLKASQAVDLVVSGKKHRTSPPLIDRFFTKAGALEKFAAKTFGKNIAISEHCNGCGWCATHCPAGNISVEPLAGGGSEADIPGKYSKPVFGRECHLCLSCIYGCPRKALSPRVFKFIVVKEGYDLKRWESMLPLKEPVDIDGLAKGVMWSGVRKYLSGQR